MKENWRIENRPTYTGDPLDGRKSSHLIDRFYLTDGNVETLLGSTWTKSDIEILRNEIEKGE